MSLDRFLFLWSEMSVDSISGVARPMERVGRSNMDAASLLEGLFASSVVFVASGAIFPLLRHSLGEGTVTVASGGPESSLYAMSFALAGGLLYRMRRDFVAVVRADPLLWLLPIMAMASVAWSTDRSETLRSATATLGSMVFGSYVALRFNAAAQVRIVALALVVVIALSIGFVIAQPSLGLDATIHAGAWRGVFTHKNGFGRAMALAFGVFAIGTIHRPTWRPFAGPLALASLVLIYLSQSKTAAVTAVAVLLLLLLTPVWRRFRVRSWMVLLVFAIVLGGLGVVSWVQRASLVHPDAGAETFTGRTILWAAVILKVAQHPILGYGYQAFWNGKAGDYVDVWQLVGWAPPHSHNGFLDVALDLGVAGLLAFVLVCVRACTRAFALQRTRLPALDRVWPSMVVGFTLLAHITEGQFFRNNLYWMLFTIASVTATRYLLPSEDTATLVQTTSREALGN